MLTFRIAACAFACLSLNLVSEASAGEFTLTVRGQINTLTGPLPAPFSAAQPGDSFLYSVSLFDQPTFLTNETRYPVDFANSRLTLGGVSAALPGPQFGELTILNDLSFGVDRIALISTPPWPNGIMTVRLDDPTSTQFDALDLGQMLDLDMGPLDPSISFVTIIGGGAIANVPLAEVRISDSTSIVPTTFGDGSGAACPCGNEATVGQGCINSTGAGGILNSYGSASLGSDNLGFWADQLPVASNAILFRGSTALNSTLGEALGAGLRGPGGSLQRLGLRTVDTLGRADWDAGVLGQSPVTVGTTYYFQAWYRDSAGSPCAGTSSNLTQSFEVTIQP